MPRNQQPVDGGSNFHGAAYRGSSITPECTSVQSSQSIPEIPPSKLSKIGLRSDEGGCLSIHSPVPGSVASPLLKKRRKKRPSSATPTRRTNTRNREEVTPWEFQALGPISNTPREKVPREFQSFSKINAPGPTSCDGRASPNQIPSRPKSSSASLASVSFSSIPPPIVSTSSLSSFNRPTSTGPVAEVTPWELYPAPRSSSTSPSLATTSTGETHNTGVASLSTSSLCLLPGTIQTTNTGPVEEVTPWELAPGPADSPSAPPSPSSENNKKSVSLFKSKPESKLSTRTSSSYVSSSSTPNFSPLADIPMDLLDTYGTMGGISMGVPPVALQRSLASPSKSASEWSPTDSRHSGQAHHGHTQSAFKWPRPGSTGRKDSFSSAGVAERTRQLPLTGPVEEVIPWEMDPPLEPEVGKKITISTGNRAVLNLIRNAATAPPMSPTIEMWKLQKSAEQLVKGARVDSYHHYTREDGRSMSSSALPLSTGGIKRPQAISEASWERTVASSASLPLRSSRDGYNETATEGNEAMEEQEVAARIPHSGDASSSLSQGKSLTGQTAAASGSSWRPASPPGSVSGHGEKMGAASMISTMNKAQMEEVAPWELYPIPIAIQRSTTSGSEMMGEDRDRPTPRTSTSSAAGKALVDLGLKKRRSTGKTSGSIAVNRVASASGTPDSVPVPSLPASVAGGQGKAISNVSAPISSSSIPPYAIGQTLLPISIIPSTSSGSSEQSRGTRSIAGKEKGPTSSAPAASGGSTLDVNLTKFSTADRTIIEELKANAQARESQFVTKGAGHMMVGGRRCPGKKYHPHRRNEVPYPRSYDREVVDLDVWETKFCLDLCKGLSWHSFETPPTKVLDIGCGTGTWIVEAATIWGKCQFVGLDIVALHPNLQKFKPPPIRPGTKDLKALDFVDLASRITWVQHNFLDGLPFPNEEFDFVHIKRIALGIPEDKWDKFLEEVQRVMKPGGALEMIEEDLFFPGKSIDDNDDESTLMDASSTFTSETLVSNGTTTLGHHRPMPQIDEQRMVRSFSDSEGSHDVHHTMGKLRISQSLVKFDPLGMSDNVAPRNPRDHSILEAIWRGMLESRFVNSAPLSLLPTYLEYHFQDVRTHPPLLYSFPPLPAKPAATEAQNTASSSENAAVACQPAPKSPIIKAPSVTSVDSNHPDNGLRLSIESSGKQRSVYVALDETRSDALSPSDLAPSPKKSKSHFATLPDLDIRTLNLHLSLRAKEIVACSEPMWEWVQEFQIKQSRKPRFRSDSIEVMMLGSTRALNGRDADVLIKDAILEMTRDDFDQVLTNFQLDIQDKAGIKDALERRFDWHTFTSEPLQDRKAFDSACRRYDEWLANETRNQLGRGGHGYYPSKYLRNEMTILPIAEGDEHSADVASWQNTAHSSSSTVHPHLPRQLLSCQQLSRAMRVFVAWKEAP